MKALAAFLLAFAPHAVADIAFVSAYKDLPFAAVEAIFRFETHSYPDGSRIKLFVLPRDHGTTRQLAHFLGTTPTRFHERADSAFSSGKLNQLKIMDTDRELIREVSRTNGGIGYANEAWVNPGSAATVISPR